jgi:hypothetical protein
MTSKKIMKQIEGANERDLGQFHVFNLDVYYSTYNSFDVAKVIAEKQDHPAVYNSSGKLVYC